jgi:copper(I)-binding protein
MRVSKRLANRLVVVAAVACAGCATVQSQPPGSDSIHLSQAWARRAPMQAQGGAGGHGQAGGSGNGAVYVSIENRGREPDTLLAAASDAAATVELHETRQEGGVMRMRPLPKVDLPPGGRLDMKPGGHHIMLLGLTRDLHPGDKVTVRLRFERAGERVIEAPVR